MNLNEDTGVEAGNVQPSESTEQLIVQAAEEKKEPVKQPEKQEKLKDIVKPAEHVHHEHHRKFSFKHVYEHNYKQLLWIPLIIIILAIGQIVYQIGTTGDFVNKGISLKGGTIITIPGKIYDTKELQHFLTSMFVKTDISVRASTAAGRNVGLIVESDIQSTEQVTSMLKAIGEKLGTLTKEDYSIEQMGPSLGASFFRETFKSIIFAFILMAAFVVFYFRVPIPSLMVILCAFSDIITTVAVFNILGYKLSTAGVAALLMLVGYSVDTDILLTSRVLKRKKGTVVERIYTAINTGLTMTTTTVVSVIVALIFTQSEVLREIMIIVLIGLIIDTMYTWILNTGLLRMYCEKKNIR